MQKISSRTEKLCHTHAASLYPPKNLNKNHYLESPPKRPTPARRLLRAVVSSLLLGGLVLGWPGTGGAHITSTTHTHTCTRGAPPTTVTGDLAADCNTLLDIQETLRPTGTLIWDAGTDMDLWTGVTIAGTPPRVTKLIFASDGPLNGEIPTTLNNLTALEELHLNETQLSGPIPDLRNLTALKVLALGYNQLSGPIPAWVNDLTNLQRLYLHNNQLSGPIPNLSALTALTQLSLNNNQLSGPIPNLSALTALTHLSLNNNQLSGPIPAWVNDLTNLTHLSLHNNQLSGPIPNLSNLTALGELYLNDNNFDEGAVPAWVNNLPNLGDLHLANTNRTGAFPTLSRTDWGTLDLSNNAFTAGALPPWVSRINVNYLYLANTNRTGAFPDLSGLPNLDILDLSNNAFDAGVVPPWVNARTSLWHLYLANTNRTGAFPTLSGLSNLERLDLGDNAFDEGALPAWVKNRTTLTHLYLDNTRLTGTIPDLSALVNLEILDLSGNQLEGAIPSTLRSPPLQALYLHHNQLTGNLPSGLRNRPSLVVLRLGNNGENTFGLVKEITITDLADTLTADFATHDPLTDPCGTVKEEDGGPVSLPPRPTLREALIYANSTAAAETITFARRLRGQTLTLDGDGDTSTAPTPLPWLCGANTTLDGDVNGDGTPDITLDGTDTPTGTDGLVITAADITVKGFRLTNMKDIGIHVLHRTTLNRSVSTTQITQNTVTGGTHGILVQAGEGSTAGSLSATTIRANTVTGTSAVGIGVVTKVADSSLTATTIEQNEVYANAGHGIAAWSEAENPEPTPVNSLTGLTIRDNQIHDQTTGSGIAVTGGFCGGRYNRVQATVTDNTLSKNGQANTFPAIAVTGGSNAGSACATPMPDTKQNHLTITLTHNISEDPPDVGLAVTGGTTNANENTVTATLTGNTVWRSGVAGLAVTGGMDSADDNTVTATLTDNLVARNTAPASGSAGHGLALRAAAADPTNSDSSNNEITLSGQGNIIALARNIGDTSPYDILREQNNADPTRTGTA